MQKDVTIPPTNNLPGALCRISPVLSISSSSEKEASDESNHKRAQTYPLPRGAYRSEDIAFQEKLMEAFYARPRNESQAKFLFKIIKNFSFMQILCHETAEEDNNLSEETVMKVVKSMKYMRVPQGKIIYKQGEVSNSEIYVVFSGEVGIAVSQNDMVTNQNMKKLETFKKISNTMTNKPAKTMEEAQTGDFDPLLADFIESYFTSRQVETNQAKSNNTPRFLLPIPYMDPSSYSPFLTKVSTLIKSYILFMRGLKRRQRICQAATKFGNVRDRINRGGYFGEIVALEQKLRQQTALALSNCELLVVEASAFEGVKEEFYRRCTIIRDFVFQHFPKLYDFKSWSVRESLMHTMEARRFDLNNKIISERAPGEYFYIIFSGQCEVSKDITIIEDTQNQEACSIQRKSFTRHATSTRKKLLLTTISRGVFFGEEILLSQEMKYNYTVRVISSKAIVLAIDVHRFAARFPREVYDALKEAYGNKELRYLEVLKNLLVSTLYEEFELIEDGKAYKKSASSPTVNILRKPLKFKRKKVISIAQSSLLIEDSSQSRQNKQPNQSQSSHIGHSNRKELTSLGVFSTRRDSEIQQELLSLPMTTAFPSSQDISHHHGTYGKGIHTPGSKRESIVGSTILQIPQIPTNSDLMQFFHTTIDHTPKRRDSTKRPKSPRKSIFKKDTFSDYAKDMNNHGTRTPCHLVEENTEILRSHLPVNIIKSVGDSQEFARRRNSRFGISANHSPVSASSRNTPMSMRNGDDMPGQEFESVRIFEPKKHKVGLPSRFHEASKTKRSREPTESPEAKEKMVTFERILVPPGSDFSKYSSIRVTPKQDVRIVQLRQKLEKLQKTSLYTRSVTYRELEEPVKSGKSVGTVVTTHQLLVTNQTPRGLTTLSTDGDGMNGSPHHISRSIDKNCLKIPGLVETPRYNNSKSVKDRSCQREGKEFAKLVKPIIFPLKKKKVKAPQKLLALGGLSNEETLLSAKNPTVSMNSTRRTFGIPALYFGSFSKVEDSLKSNAREGKTDNKRPGQVSLDSPRGLIQGMDRYSKILQKNKANKQRMEAVMNKINVYVEDVVPDPDYYGRYSQR